MTKLLTATALALLLLPALARGQEITSSFDKFAGLQVGDTVRVTDKEGRRTEGVVRTLSVSSLTLDDTLFAIPEVRSIEKHVGRRTAFGAAVGAAAGAGAGVAGYVGCNSSEAHGCAALFPLCAGIGAGSGALFGALTAKRQLVYRAPGGQPVQLSVAPFIGRRANGLTLTFSF